MDIVYPKRKAGVKATVLPEGHVVLFDTTTDWAHTLNPLAAMAWELSDGEHSVPDIVDEIVSLVEELPLDSRELELQLTEFFEELTSAGFLENPIKKESEP